MHKCFLYHHPLAFAGTFGYSGFNDQFGQDRWYRPRPTGRGCRRYPSGWSASEAASDYYYSGRRTRPRLNGFGNEFPKAIGGGKKNPSGPFSSVGTILTSTYP